MIDADAPLPPDTEAALAVFERAFSELMAAGHSPADTAEHMMTVALGAMCQIGGPKRTATLLLMTAQQMVADLEPSKSSH